MPVAVMMMIRKLQVQVVQKDFNIFGSYDQLISNKQQGDVPFMTHPLVCKYEKEYETEVILFINSIVPDNDQLGCSR